jgi:hypothetical protein
MEYDESVQREKAEKTVNFGIQLFRLERDDLTHDEAKLYWTYAAFSYLVCGTRFKHPSYKNEKEWRVFVSRPNRDGANQRAGAHGPIPYITMPLPRDTVTGLIKGPACTCADGELRRLLEDAGYQGALRIHR